MLKDKKKYIQLFLLFVVYFIVQYKFLNAEWFITDEMDIMAGGKAISSGYQLYGDFYSQHMPFSYYVSAVFDLFGAKTLYTQRLSFYFFYAIMWVVIYVRYRNVVNAKALMIYPLIFSALTCCYQYGTVVLSEHLAGLGFVILYLELIKFINQKKLDVWSCLFISFAIVLTFGTIFIAAFGVFVIAVSVFIKEAKWGCLEERKLSKVFINIIKKYIPLIVIVLIPWLVLCIYYLVNGVFDDFILGAYTLNREVYSKYIGGMGGDILASILESINGIANMVVNIFNVSSFNITAIIYLTVLLLICIYVIQLFENNNKYLGIVTIIFLLSIGIRGYFCYHGTQWVEVVSLIISLVICDILVVDKEIFKRKTYIYKVCIVSMIVVMFSPYLSTTSNLATNKELLLKYEESLDYRSKIIEAITDEDEAVWQLTFYNQFSMETDRPIIKNVGSTPWFWEVMGKETIYSFREEPPRVALFLLEQDCWGYKMVDYAPELVEYIEDNYIRYGETEIYIRDDYYYEACDKIENIQ